MGSLALLAVLRALVGGLTGDFLRSRGKVEFLVERLETGFDDPAALAGAQRLLAAIAAAHPPHARRLVELALRQLRLLTNAPPLDIPPPDDAFFAGLLAALADEPAVLVDPAELERLLPALDTTAPPPTVAAAVLSFAAAKAPSYLRPGLARRLSAVFSTNPPPEALFYAARAAAMLGTAFDTRPLLTAVVGSPDRSELELPLLAATCRALTGRIPPVGESAYALASKIYNCLLRLRIPRHQDPFSESSKHFKALLAGAKGFRGAYCELLVPELRSPALARLCATLRETLALLVAAPGFAADKRARIAVDLAEKARLVDAGSPKAAGRVASLVAVAEVMPGPAPALVSALTTPPPPSTDAVLLERLAALAAREPPAEFSDRLYALLLQPHRESLLARLLLAAADRLGSLRLTAENAAIKVFRAGDAEARAVAARALHIASSGAATPARELVASLRALLYAAVLEQPQPDPVARAHLAALVEPDTPGPATWAASRAPPLPAIDSTLPDELHGLATQAPAALAAVEAVEAAPSVERLTEALTAVNRACLSQSGDPPARAWLAMRLADAAVPLGLAALPALRRAQASPLASATAEAVRKLLTAMLDSPAPLLAGSASELFEALRVAEEPRGEDWGELTASFVSRVSVVDAGGRPSTPRGSLVAGFLAQLEASVRGRIRAEVDATRAPASLLRLATALRSAAFASDPAAFSALVASVAERCETASSISGAGRLGVLALLIGNAADRTAAGFPPAAFDAAAAEAAAPLAASVYAFMLGRRAAEAPGLEFLAGEQRPALEEFLIDSAMVFFETQPSAHRKQWLFACLAPIDCAELSRPTHCHALKPPRFLDRKAALLARYLRVESTRSLTSNELAFLLRAFESPTPAIFESGPFLDLLTTLLDSEVPRLPEPLIQLALTKILPDARTSAVVAARAAAARGSPAAFEFLCKLEPEESPLDLFFDPKGPELLEEWTHPSKIRYATKQLGFSEGSLCVIVGLALLRQARMKISSQRIAAGGQRKGSQIEEKEPKNQENEDVSQNQENEERSKDQEDKKSEREATKARDVPEIPELKSLRSLLVSRLWESSSDELQRLFTFSKSSSASSLVHLTHLPEIYSHLLYTGGPRLQLVEAIVTKLAESDENSARLVSAFCEGESPENVKDWLRRVVDIGVKLADLPVNDEKLAEIVKEVGEETAVFGRRLKEQGKPAKLPGLKSLKK